MDDFSEAACTRMWRRIYCFLPFLVDGQLRSFRSSIVVMLQASITAQTLPVVALNFSCHPSGKGSFGRTATEGLLSTLSPSAVLEATVNLLWISIDSNEES